MQGEKASLAGSTGLGLLVVRAGHISGYWRAEAGCPRLYTRLHDLYQSQETVLYCGCVYDEATRSTSRKRLEVVISSWARHDHPNRLKLRVSQPSLNRLSSPTLRSEEGKEKSSPLRDEHLRVSRCDTLESL